MRNAPGTVAGIVLDCDGLLVDTEVCWTRAERTMFAERGHGFGVEEKQLVIGRTLLDAGESMAEFFGEPGRGPQLAVELLRRVREELSGGADALPGAADLVRACVDVVPVAVASNSPRDLVDAALASSGLAPLLGDAPVLTADDVRHGKPAPDLYLSACARLDAPPGRCVAFEDSGTGVASARAAGLYVVTVPSLAGSGLDHDWLLPRLDHPELVTWLGGLGAGRTPEVEGAR